MGDALPDSLESLLGTDPALVDTDGDGFNDSEELARHSDPTRHISTPLATTMDVAVAVSAHDGKLNTVSAMYFQDGVLADKTFTLGVLVHGQVVPLGPARYTKSALHTVPSNDPNSLVIILAVQLDASPLHQVGSLSLFSTIAGADGVVAGASAIDLVSVQGVIMERRTSYDEGYASAAAPGSPQTGAGAGGLYLPLGGNIPSTWNQGQVCAQTLSVVGVEGPVVTQEVDDAGCEDSLEGACSPGGCGATVGTTVRVMDPIALIGG